MLSRDILTCILLHDLNNSLLKIHLSNMNTPLSQCKHARLRADSLNFSPAGLIEALGDGFEVDSSREIHLSAMNSQNLQSRRLIRVRELNLSIDAPRPEERGVEDIDAVRGHQDLNVVRGLEAVQLVDELQHRALDFGVPVRGIKTLPSDGVDLVHEDDGGRVLAGHHEELADHARPLADVLLDKFAAAHADEGAVCVMGDGSGKKSLAGARRTVQKNTLGLGNTETVEELRVLDGKLNNLFDFACVEK